MNFFNRTSLKFFLGFVAIVIASISIAFSAFFFNTDKDEHRESASIESREEIHVSDGTE